MASYRSRLDIIADILNVIGEGSKKTQVMYGANLSYKLLTKYLNEVLEVGFVCFEKPKECYVVTVKGRAFLEEHKEYVRRSRSFEKSLNDINSKRKNLEKLCEPDRSVELKPISQKRRHR